MARMTAEQDALVVRLVYDGPPRSGKTTSLGALAQGMARPVFSPAEEEGRTLYFDWLEYTGGSFDGIPIRCQILSVPGQRELAPRRRALLAEADAIVLVIDGTPEHLPAAAEHLRDLRSFVASRPSPRPGVVVQANHRDRPDALPLAALRDGLGLDGLALVESVATESQGIREAFVLAVRLALDRARELLARSALPAGPGEMDDPDALLAWLQAATGEEPSATPRPAASAEPEDQPSPRLPGQRRPRRRDLAGRRREDDPAFGGRPRRRAAARKRWLLAPANGCLAVSFGGRARVRAARGRPAGDARLGPEARRSLQPALVTTLYRAGGDRSGNLAAVAGRPRRGVFTAAA